MTEVIRFNQLDLSKIKYSKPENQQNAYYGGIHYNDNAFHIQTSKMIFQEIKDDKASKSSETKKPTDTSQSSSTEK